MNGKTVLKFLLGLYVLMSALVLQAQLKQVQYLSGKGYLDTVSWDFFCTGGRQSGYWTKIEVPSCWEQQGFGAYNYGRDYKTNGKHYRFNDEKGLYKHNFTVPDSWKDKEVFIVFEGSMTDTEVKINGRQAGAVHQGAFYRFKYNITDKLLWGKSNVLEVTVSKMSADPSVNNAERLADYWVFGGIFRPVYLEVVPRQHIDYFAIDARVNGDLSVRSFLKNVNKKLELSAEIIDAKGGIVRTLVQPVNAGDTVVTVNAKLAGVASWTAETPTLYTAVITLKDGARTVYKTSTRFGFRTIEIKKGDGVYLNGVKIKFKGTNRHCWWPESARTLNDQIQLQDVLLLKEMNMNAVRCSHYPPDKRFLELCDSLGIYVLNELAGWQKAYSTHAGRPLVKELVLRDVNHPSIIFWDNGNEGGTNKELDAEFDKWDYSKRPVIHPHHRPGNDFNGIDCNHYEDYYSTKKILDDSLIYMPTEFLHAQDDGGAGAAMEDFWELHWAASKSAGGFIWAMVDEGVVRTDMGNVIDANGLNANDGILGPHREKEGSFFALREIFSPVKIRMKQLPVRFDGSIALENRFHFTNLKRCSFRWALINYKQPYSNLPGYAVVEKGKAISPDIAPGMSGMLQLQLPSSFSGSDALMLVATDPFGKEIYRWTWKLADNNKLLVSMFQVLPGNTVMEEQDSVYMLKGGENTIWLSKKTGLLTATKNDAMDHLSFRNGPVLAQGAGSVVSSRLYRDGKNVVAEFLYAGDMKYTKWIMQEDGWVGLEYEYSLTGSFPFAGISFDYPENYILGVKWLGKGPYRQWKNRMAGTPVNVWEKLYNNTQTGYSPMVYPEFKGYYGDITWMEFSTVEGKFYVASRDTGLFVRLFDFYALSSGVKPHPELPVGDISFLDCIPPIGTKLALNINYNTAALGPQSEPTKIEKPLRRTLFFYFGLPKTTEAKEQYSRPDVDNVF